MGEVENGRMGEWETRRRRIVTGRQRTDSSLVMFEGSAEGGD